MFTGGSIVVAGQIADNTTLARNQLIEFDNTQIGGGRLVGIDVGQDSEFFHMQLPGAELEEIE